MRLVAVVVVLLACCAASREARAEPQAQAGVPALRSVSLKDLERQVRAAIAQGGADDREIGLSDLAAYKWNASTLDIELVGPPGRDLRVGHFVGALRLGTYEALGVTLVPQDGTSPTSHHQVEFFPKDLRYMWRVAEPLLLADIDAKRRAVSALLTRHRDELKKCAESEAPDEAMARILFLPAEPDLEQENTDSGFTVWIRQADVILRPESDALFVDQTGVRPPPVDPHLVAFADEFTAGLPALGRVDPIYRQLHVMYRLVLVATLLRLETVPWSSTFWLDEYPLGKAILPETVPGLDRSVTRTCWNNAKYEYAGTSIRRRIFGGVVIAYRSYLETHVIARLRSPGSSGGATVLTSTRASTSAAPAVTTRAGALPAAVSAVGQSAKTLAVGPEPVATLARQTIQLPSAAARALMTPVTSVTNNATLRTLTSGMNLSALPPVGALGQPLAASVSSLPWGNGLSSSMLMLRPLTPFAFSPAPSSPWSSWRMPGSQFPTWNLRLPTPQAPRYSFPSPLPPIQPAPPRVPVCTTGPLGGITCR